MSPLKTYRVFISHAWTHNDEYYRVVNMLDAKPRFSWKNYSVPEHDPKHTKTNKQLIQTLKNQIKPTHAVIILAGMYVPHSYWIEKEIDIATEMKKPIIGIMPWGSQKTPKAVQDAADEIVGWNTDSIVGTIRQYCSKCGRRCRAQ